MKDKAVWTSKTAYKPVYFKPAIENNFDFTQCQSYYYANNAIDKNRDALHISGGFMGKSLNDEYERIYGKRMSDNDYSGLSAKLRYDYKNSGYKSYLQLASLYFA